MKVTIVNKGGYVVGFVGISTHGFNLENNIKIEACLEQVVKKLSLVDKSEKLFTTYGIDLIRFKKELPCEEFELFLLKLVGSYNEIDALFIVVPAMYSTIPPNEWEKIDWKKIECRNQNKIKNIHIVSVLSTLETNRSKIEEKIYKSTQFSYIFSKCIGEFTCLTCGGLFVDYGPATHCKFCYNK